jgi:hypothetical protein
VSQVLQDLNAAAHDLVGPAALDVDDQPDPARVVLVARVIESFCAALGKYAVWFLGLLGSVLFHGRSGGTRL